MTLESPLGESAPLRIEADVLIVGGGMAACWAGISAARAGAKVVLVDKGYVGTSGVTATGGPGHWWVSPEGDARKQAIDKRLRTGFGLADPGWMERIIDTTWRILPTLSAYYRFNVNDKGETVYNALRGPEYLRALRHAAVDAGVTILDQSPVLELLLHDDGSVAGANGVRRQQHRAYTARAGAVILATGGAGFLGGLLGSSTNTGDGHLMAIEAGAELSGMEFSNAYSVSPRWSSTRTLIYSYARYFDEGGNELDVLPDNDVLERALIEGPVYALLNECPDGLRKSLPQIQPMTLLPFVRKGITDVYERPFEVKLFAEGTIRGTGGLRIVGEQCETTIAGLFAAGDTATRELIVGATSGGGSPNSAWALTSGLLSGAGAAALARSRGRRVGARVRAQGTVGLRPRSSVKPVDRRSILKAAQDESSRSTRTCFALAPSCASPSEFWHRLGASYATTTTQKGPTPSLPARPRASWPRRAFAIRRPWPATKAAACTNARTPRSKSPTRVVACWSGGSMKSGRDPKPKSNGGRHMFELIVRDRCTGCNRCVEVCPTNVLEPGPDRVPVGARVEHCQTCFMCELYCKEDAIYVGPDRENREPVGEAEIVASGLLGQYRRDSGWDEWANDSRYDNQIWKLGPYIQAGGKRSVERVQLRMAVRAQPGAAPAQAVPEQPKHRL